MIFTINKLQLGRVFFQRSFDFRRRLRRRNGIHIQYFTQFFVEMAPLHQARSFFYMKNPIDPIVFQITAEVKGLLGGGFWVPITSSLFGVWKHRIGK